MAKRSKATPTRTLNTLHFEDLEPHRFEDLVRQLVYDFRDWQTIEATGRGGGDEGFDIRAWERVTLIANQDESDDKSTGEHTLEGNLWMVQCKRENAIGPSQVQKIIEDGVDSKSPPYGYILAAPANFSKKSYDTFRQSLRYKGVTEFYIWGKAELEDMLVLPKNDHVLFTFFGISLVTRRRSRATEVKFQVNNKNKLARILGEGQQSQNLYQSILLRDIKDDNYPWKEEYKDFDSRPRWVEHITFGFHPRGLLFHFRKFFAYVDTEKKVFDYTEAVDQVNRQGNEEERLEDRSEERDTRTLVEDYWKHLPRKNQAQFHIDRMVTFSDMLVIDEKGDLFYEFPHIFVDFDPQKGPFKHGRESLTMAGQEVDLDEEGYKRVKIFPKVFPKVRRGKVYRDKSVVLDATTLDLFTRGADNDAARTLFDVDGRYDFLKIRDAILVAGAKMGNDNLFLTVTYRYQTTLQEYLVDRNEPFMQQSIERQAGRKVEVDEKLNVLEIERIYEWALK